MKLQPLFFFPFPLLDFFLQPLDISMKIGFRQGHFVLQIGLCSRLTPPSPPLHGCLLLQGATC